MITIDITGPKGNAFYLMGEARSLGKQLKYSEEKLKELDEDMKSSDYEHLLEVFEEHFGEFVKLIRQGE